MFAQEVASKKAELEAANTQLRKLEADASKITYAGELAPPGPEGAALRRLTAQRLEPIEKSIAYHRGLVARLRRELADARW